MPRTVSRTRRSEETEEEQPTRGRARHHDEDDAPRRRRPASRDADYSDDEDEDDVEDEQPARRGRATKVKDEPRRSSRKGNSGWGGVAEAKDALGDFAKDLKLEQNEEILIHFGEDEPFDVYKQHWIERKGKRSFTCAIAEKGDDCPLCDVGDKPSPQVAFNVISLADPDEPALFRWVVGVKIATMIEDFAKDKKTSPINGLNQYFAVKRTKKNDSWNTTVVPVKARDLVEDYDCEPLTQDEIDDLMKDAYTWESTEDTPLKVLNDIADELG